MLEILELGEVVGDFYPPSTLIFGCRDGVGTNSIRSHPFGEFDAPKVELCGEVEGSACFEPCMKINKGFLPVLKVERIQGIVKGFRATSYLIAEFFPELIKLLPLVSHD